MLNKELDKKFNHLEVEKNKYDFWLENDLFSPTKNGEPFSIILPPPNVTGHLHLGHAWDVSLQDTIIRYKKLKGFSTLWAPGTDHAGIATQTKFEKILKETTQKNRFDLGRSEFLKLLWDWKQSQSDFIHEQWKKMGLALSYSHEIFTMDEYVNGVVNYVFVNLYKEGLIYRAKKLVNWDPILKTAISNIEVIHEVTKSKMYYFDYYSADKKHHLLVATTRPETMFGDVCLFANPKDQRYQGLNGIEFVNPANNKLLPLIFDEYVDPEFGTGVMKCTPAHDFNDYELAKKYDLELINVMNEDASMNELAEEFAGLNNLECRKQVVEKIKKNGLLNKIEEIENNIGYSERTKAVVEPYLSWQWFVKMKHLANQTILNQNLTNNKTVHFEPKRFNETLLTWLEKIEDWCISRQLWWGHQIPIWYHKTTKEIYCDVKPPKNQDDYEREIDVLDTWFSSALWPMVCFGWKKSDDCLFKKYFPSNVLVTGYDIIFFWVSRMMMQTNHFTNQKPFHTVLIHGLIRDEFGRKMSKSLGNGIDPMDVIKTYGCDSLRLFLTSTAAHGEDLNYSPTKLSSNWNFLNKLWNSARYILKLNQDYGKNLDLNLQLDDLNQLKILDLWILNKFNDLIFEINKNMDDFNFVVSTKKIISFVWDEFSNQYLELSKLDIKDKRQAILTLKILNYLIKQILIILHPQCPFITEEIYQFLPIHKKSIMLENWPEPLSVEKDLKVELILEIIDAVRKLRADYNLKNNQKLELNIFGLNDYAKKRLISFKWIYNHYLKFVNAEVVDGFFDKKNKIINAITKNHEINIQANQLFDANEQKQKLLKTINDLEAEVKRAQAILENVAFLKKAPAKKIDLEKQKLQNYLEQLEVATRQLNELIENENY